MKFKVLKVRVCSQCHELLPQRCDKCVKHPDRKPKIQIRYGMPQILDKCPSGHCVKIECQVDPALRPADCKKVFWRGFHQANAPRKFQELFCGVRCSAIMTASKVSKKTTMQTCANKLCQFGENGKPKVFPVQAYRLKLYTEFTCSQACRVIEWRRKYWLQKEQKKEEISNLVFLECRGRCGRGIVTEHRKEKNVFHCIKCGQARTTSDNLKRARPSQEAYQEYGLVIA